MADNGDNMDVSMCLHYNPQSFQAAAWLLITPPVCTFSISEVKGNMDVSWGFAEPQEKAKCYSELQVNRRGWD